MTRPYRMTPGRRAALRKAQLASARARKGHGNSGNIGPWQHRVNTGQNQQARFNKPMSTTNKILIGSAVVGSVAAVGAGTYYGGKYALNNPTKFGGLGHNLDVNLTHTVWYVGGMRKTVSWKVEKYAHMHRSTRTVRSFMNTQRMYKENRLTAPDAKVAYREFAHQCAQHRLRRLKGQTTHHFNYGSGMPNRELNKKIIIARTGKTLYGVKVKKAHPYGVIH